MEPQPVDPSLAFTALLEAGALAGLTQIEGALLRDAMLRDYYAQDGARNLWTFTRQWLDARRAAHPEWTGERCAACDHPVIASASPPGGLIHAFSSDVAEYPHQARVKP